MNKSNSSCSTLLTKSSLRKHTYPVCKDNINPRFYKEELNFPFDCISLTRPSFRVGKAKETQGSDMIVVFHQPI